MEFSADALWISLLLLVLRIALGGVFLYHSFSFPWRQYRPVRLAIYLSCLVFAVLGTVVLPLQLKITDHNTIQEKISPVQIFLDVSLSMTADDVSPSRFQLAKQGIQSLVTALPHGQLSLIAYSGIPLVWIPYTQDHNAFAAKLAGTSMESFPPETAFLGTALGDALLLGLRNMEQQGYNTGTWIIISDGDNNKGYDPAQLLTRLNLLPLRIHSIAIGEDNVLLGYDKDKLPVMTDFDTSFLQEVSLSHSGLFFHIVASNDAVEYFEAIAVAIDTERNITAETTYISLSRYILLYLVLFALGHLGYIMLYAQDFLRLIIEDK